MQEKQNNIKVIDAETLMDKRLPPTLFASTLCYRKDCAFSAARLK